MTVGFEVGLTRTQDISLAMAALFGDPGLVEKFMGFLREAELDDGRKEALMRNEHRGASQIFKKDLVSDIGFMTWGFIMSHNMGNSGEMFGVRFVEYPASGEWRVKERTSVVNRMYDRGIVSFSQHKLHGAFARFKETVALYDNNDTHTWDRSDSGSIPYVYEITATAIYLQRY